MYTAYELVLSGKNSQVQGGGPIGCPIFIGRFPQKNPIISGSFAKMTCNLRHHKGLRHQVSVISLHMCLCTKTMSLYVHIFYRAATIWTRVFWHK